MAGGMNRGRNGPSLAERAAGSGVPVPTAPSTLHGGLGGAPREDAGQPGGHGRHCWVRDPPDAPGIWPGLLIEWRRREGGRGTEGWHGRVAYAVVGEHGPVLVEAWLPAGCLTRRPPEDRVG